MKKLNLEKDLKIIKDSELDIELLERANEKLCVKNNEEIEYFKSAIAIAENNLKAELEISGKDKLECKLGSVIFRKMPDKWIYQDDILLAWIVSLPKKLQELYLKVTTTIKRVDLKKNIISDLTIFENGKIIDKDVTLFLHDDYAKANIKVEGIEIEPQEPKFSYTIKKIKK